MSFRTFKFFSADYTMMFKKKEAPKERVPSFVVPPPDMADCTVVFERCLDILYEKKRTILELEVVVGMLQNEIIINKTYNAIMGQVGRLAFIPPTISMGPTEQVAVPSKDNKTGIQ